MLPHLIAPDYCFDVKRTNLLLGRRILNWCRKANIFQVEGVVNGIPSIHVTSKFTGPLLQQGSLQKQLFSTCLLSYLSVQYPIPQTLGYTSYLKL